MKRFKCSVVCFLVLLITLALIAGCTPTGSEAGTAEANPHEEQKRGNIEFVVGADAGGGTDIAARTIAVPLGKILGQTVVIINRPGATGGVAMEYVNKKPADGTTITMATDSWSMTWAQSKDFTPDDFQAVARFQSDPRLFVIRADDERFSTWEEVLKYAKENPDKQLNVGGGVSLGMDSVVTEKSNEEMGLNMKYVPMGATGEAVAGLLGGHLDIVTGSIQSFIGHIDSGDLKLVLTFTEERLAPFPDVPTAIELGYDIEATLARGILVKSGTPQEEVERLQNAVKEAMQTEEYKEFEKSAYLDMAPGFLGSDDFQKYMEDLYEVYKQELSN